jgi:hypothetical protein
MRRLDDPSQTTLQHLIEHVGASKAEIIRQLIASAAPEDYPSSWHMRAAERRVQQARQQGTGTDQQSPP